MGSPAGNLFTLFESEFSKVMHRNLPFFLIVLENSEEFLFQVIDLLYLWLESFQTHIFPLAGREEIITLFYTFQRAEKYLRNPQISLNQRSHRITIDPRINLSTFVFCLYLSEYMWHELEPICSCLDGTALN